MKYTHAFTMASLAVEALHIRGQKFREGVERAAALAASPTDSRSAAIDAMERTLNAYRINSNPHWDGTIG